MTPVSGAIRGMSSPQWVGESGKAEGVTPVLSCHGRGLVSRREGQVVPAVESKSETLGASVSCRW